MFRTLLCSAVLLLFCVNGRLVSGQQAPFTPTFNTVGHIRFGYYEVTPRSGSVDQCSQTATHTPYREKVALTNQCILFGTGSYYSTVGSMMYTCVEENSAYEALYFSDENCQQILQNDLEGGFSTAVDLANGCMLECTNDDGAAAPVTPTPAISTQVINWYTEPSCSDSSYVFGYSTLIDECIWAGTYGRVESFAAICTTNGSDTQAVWSYYEGNVCQQRPAQYSFHYNTQCTEDPFYSNNNLTLYSKVIQCGNSIPPSTTTAPLPSTTIATTQAPTTTPLPSAAASLLTVNVVPSYHAGDSVRIRFTGRGSSANVQICLIRLAGVVNYYCDIVVSSNAVLSYDSGYIDYVLPIDLPEGEYSLAAGFNLLNSNQWQNFAFEGSAFRIVPRVARQASASSTIHANKENTNAKHTARRLNKWPFFVSGDAEQSQTETEH